MQFNAQCECCKQNKLLLPYNFFLDGIGGGFGHPGHPLTPSLPAPSPPRAVGDATRQRTSGVAIVANHLMEGPGDGIGSCYHFGDFYIALIFRLHNADTVSSVTSAALSIILHVYIPTHRPPQPAHTLKDTCHLPATLSFTSVLTDQPACWPPPSPLPLSASVWWFWRVRGAPSVAGRLSGLLALSCSRRYSPIYHCRLGLRTRTIT